MGETRLYLAVCIGCIAGGIGGLVAYVLSGQNLIFGIVFAAISGFGSGMWLKVDKDEGKG